MTIEAHSGDSWRWGESDIIIQMDYPKHIRIKHNVSYKIIWVEGFDDPHDAQIDNGNKKTIYIKKGMSLRKTRKALIHELLHALEWEYDVHLTHAAISQLENPILRLLQLNGWLPSGF